MNSITLLSPAKINRTLHIGKRQKSGLHLLESHVEKIPLYDVLEIKWSNGSGKTHLFLDPKSQFFVPTDTRNTIMKAGNLFFEYCSLLKNIQKKDLHITLTKNIPLQAGLGGGSSNAGVFLQYLQETCSIPKEHILSIAHTVGSDVPLFLQKEVNLFVSGTGEYCAPLEERKTTEAILLLVPNTCSSSSGWAYSQWDVFMKNKTGREASKRRVLETYRNDFSYILPSYFPEIGSAYTLLQKMGAHEVSITGSGSGVYGLFLEKEWHTIHNKKFEQYWSWSGLLGEDSFGKGKIGQL